MGLRSASLQGMSLGQKMASLIKIYILPAFLSYRVVTNIFGFHRTRVKEWREEFCFLR
jgi:hypothetical protein